MPLQPRYEFGDYRLDPNGRVLWRGTALVRLTGKEFDILYALAQRAGAPADMEALKPEVWPDTHVADDNLRQHIRALRQKLGKDSNGQDYICNVPNRGYFLAATVHEVSVEEPPTRIFPHNRGGAGQPPVSQRLLKQYRVRQILGWLGGALLVTVVLCFTLSTARQPVVISVRPLTKDGVPKIGSIFTDGTRVYFLESNHHHPTPVSVSVNGGEVNTLDLPLPRPTIVDMASGPRFLVEAPNARGEPFLWEWSPGQKPRPFWVMKSSYAAWGPDAEIVEAIEGERGELHWTNSGKRLTFPQLISYPRWSAVHRALRFTANDFRGENSSIWEMRDPDAPPRALSGFPPRSSNGVWSADGSIFVFLAQDEQTPRWQGQNDLWAVDENASGFRVGHRRPVRLTKGPLNYLAAVPSPDGKRIFALGQTQNGELVRYDHRIGEFVPFVKHLWAVQTDYSRDGQWIAYAKYPERTLWKMRQDGSQQTQLTFARLGVHEPHWSPDGSQIAFMGEPSIGRYRLYVVSSQGGVPTELAAFDRDDQGVPTWSPDGRRIVFGELLFRKPRSEMSIRVLDLDSKAIETVPGSKGVWSPRWSPDGKYILGLSSDNRRLLLFDWKTSVWKELATSDFIEDLVWAINSSAIYFLAVSTDGADRGYYRFLIHSQKMERVADLAGFEEADGAWFRVTPDGTPLGVRSNHVTEVYSVELR